MTSTVSFHFDSPQFTFRSGFITFTKGARLNSTGEISTGELRDGSIDGVLVEGPIVFDAMLYQLSVVRKTDNHVFNVSLLLVSRALTVEAIASGRIEVTLDLPLVLRIQVRNSADAAVPATISLTLPSLNGGATFEVPADGELVIFGMPGWHSIRLVSTGDRQLVRERVGERFELSSADRGERVIVLRVPPERQA